MPGGGGGTPGSPGTVVGGPAPWAAMAAGGINAKAAQEAALLNLNTTNLAMNTLRDQYATAVQSLRPNTQSGLQALNELNRYLGMSAYNPGNAPVKPVAPQGPGTDPESIFNSIRAADIYKGPGNRDNLTGAANISNQLKGGNLIRELQNAGIARYSGDVVQNPTLGDLQRVYNENRQAYDKIANLVNEQNTNPWGQRDIERMDYENKMAAYNQQMDQYNMAKEMYDKYQQQGPMTPEQVQAALANTPGYQFQMNQGVDAIQRSASAKGLLGSGRLLQSLVDYSSGLANQTYGQHLSRLAALAGAGQQAATDVAGMGQNYAGQVAGLAGNLGDTLGNGRLAAGNAMAQAILAANQEYKVVGASKGSGGGGGLGGLGSVLGSVLSKGGTSGGAAGGIFSGLFSNSAFKDKIETPTTEEILERVKALHIDKWKYKGIDEAHIGPYAEEFKDQFGVGDGKTINLIDAIGVLFATVKALTTKLEDIQAGSKTNAS